MQCGANDKILTRPLSSGKLIALIYNGDKRTITIAVVIHNKSNKRLIFKLLDNLINVTCKKLQIAHAYHSNNIE